jgi:hypothetical protein
VNEFTKLLNRIADGYPTRLALAQALDINASRLSRALNGSDPHTSFNIENCLRLAKVSGEPASRVLRAADKGTIADLIEELYGPEKGVTDAVVQELLREWSTFTAAEKSYVRSNVTMMLRARAGRVSGAHTAEGTGARTAESRTNADGRHGRDRAITAELYGQTTAVPDGATMRRLRADFERATRDVERARDTAARAPRAAGQPHAAARAPTAGGSRSPRKARR